MADANQLRRLVAYNEWANGRLLKAIDGMTADELARPVEAYFGTVAKNLQHVLNATRVWLARWKGQVPAGLQDAVTAPWREAFAAVHAEFHAFVEPLTDADAGRIVQYKDSKGNPFAMPLDQLITHVVNHGTHHRAETGMLLERIGRSPGDMDYVYYLRVLAKT